MWILLPRSIVTCWRAGFGGSSRGAHLHGCGRCSELSLGRKNMGLWGKRSFPLAVRRSWRRIRERRPFQNGHGVGRDQFPVGHWRSPAKAIRKKDLHSSPNRYGAFLRLCFALSLAFCYILKIPLSPHAVRRLMVSQSDSWWWPGGPSAQRRVLFQSRVRVDDPGRQLSSCFYTRRLFVKP